MKNIFFLLCFLASIPFYSQITSPKRTCGTDTLPQAYENWVQGLSQRNTGGNGRLIGQNGVQSVFNIPVIVHVIHNNEAINGVAATSGGNLNAAQIIDQINILNKDFNGTNPDTSLIPLAFKPLLGKVQVNFCLAVVNPTGGVLAEPGIDRINRVAKGWTAPPFNTTYITNTIKPNSIWDPNKYMNMWVCAISGGVLGYATFPNPGTSGLLGLGAPFGTATTDGLVMLNTAFGSIGTAVTNAPYHKGRTATHEIGHWMGLRHIWGDSNCGTDYCNDTPPAQTSNFGCPVHPYKVGVCAGNTSGEMTMNYMDYTDDLCMYMFSKDQKNRAQLIMTHSPMRAALITSTVCNLPNVGNDVGISFVANPTYSQVLNCTSVLNPIVNLTNYGSTVLNSALFSFNVNGINTQTLVWTGTLNPGNSSTVALSPIANLTNGAHVFSVNVAAPNGGPETNLINNNSLQQFSVINLFTLSVSSVTTCAGSNAVLTASGASTYSWNGLSGGSSIVANPLSTTIYTVAASNGSCTITKTTSILVSPVPTISVNSGSVCFGNTFTLNASGASSYTWSIGGSASTITVAPTTNTTYTVIGSNSLGCSSYQTSSVAVVSNPTLSTSNVTICAGGIATLQASGAITYSWSTGSLFPTTLVSPTATTIYTVTGSNGFCNNTKTVSVSLGSSLSVSVFPAATALCAGQSLTLMAGGATTYSWSSGTNGSSLVITPVISGNYTLVGTAGACNGTAIASVVVNPNPITTVSSMPVSCFGGSNGQLIVSSSGQAPYTYSYSGGSSTNLPAGTYTIITTAANGCTSTNTATILQPSMVLYTLNVVPTSCPNSCDGIITPNALNSTVPFTFSLAPAATSSALCTGNYTMFITDGNMCLTQVPFFMPGGNNGLNLSTSANNVSCASCGNGSVSVTAISGTAPFTYLWLPGNYVTPSVTEIGEGCYTVTVSDALGCSSNTNACVYLATGIHDNVSNQEIIKVSPNPGDGLFEFSFPIALFRELEITDARGRLIREFKTYASKTNIDIKECANGVYYARIISEKGIAVVKLLKN